MADAVTTVGQAFGIRGQLIIWGPMSKALRFVFMNAWDQLYAPDHAWTNDEISGRLLVEGLYLPPQAAPPLSGTISIDLKDVKDVVDKATKEIKKIGKAETREDFSALCRSRSNLVEVGDRLRVEGAGAKFDVVVTRITAPKIVGAATKSKYIFGTLEFEFIDAPPTVDIAECSVAKVTVKLWPT